MIAKTVDLPVAQYAKAAFGILGCAAVGLALGLVADVLAHHAHDGLRIAIISAVALVGTFGALATWQHVTPRSIVASLR